VKDGGWLAFDGATGFIYGATGNKTSDLHRYDAVANTWTVRSGVPMGTEGKPPSKGAAACADGAGVIYVTKGNSTTGFYRYTTRGDSWYQLPDVPLGTTGKKVKGGTDLAYVPAETDSGAAGAYLLKGTQNEFWRYDPASGQWMSLRDAPAEKWGKGSWLVFDGSHTIYAHQAKDHGFFAYNTVTGMWGTARPGMPLVGRSGKSKKSKDGGSATWSSGCIYALKGGGTQEFWRYKPEGDSWRELDTVPLLGTTGKKKKVKGGGDITTFAPGAFFAFKGGGTQEFWRYVTPVALGAPTADRSGATAVALDARRPAIAVSPNPLRSGLIALRMDGSAARSSSGRVEVDVHDATGRRVFHSSLATREPSFTMDLGSLPSGVYVVRLSAGHVAVTQRLVLQR
jgi:hypothetical protein